MEITFPKIVDALREGFYKVAYTQFCNEEDNNF